MLSIHEIIKGVHAKSLKTTLLFVDFSKAFASIHRGKIEQIQLAYGLAIMMPYKDMKAMFLSPNSDIDFSDIIIRVSQGDKLAPFLFIICQGDFVYGNEVE